MFKVIFRKLMSDLGAPFGFYNGDCFDRVVVLFNFVICICEYPVGVNYLWQPLASADVFFCVCMFTRVYSVCLCEFSYRCTWAFDFFFITLLLQYPKTSPLLAQVLGYVVWLSEAVSWRLWVSRDCLMQLLGKLSSHGYVVPDSFLKPQGLSPRL